PSCRIYSSDKGGFSRTPTVETVSLALGDKPANKRGHFRTVAASFPAFGAALLPKLTCPFCWPAYTAMLSALGLGFVDYTPYLLPATLVFLAIGVGALMFRARKTGRLLPVTLGLIASVVVLLGKFAVDSNWATDTGLALLVGAIFCLLDHDPFGRLPVLPAPLRR